VHRSASVEIAHPPVFAAINYAYRRTIGDDGLQNKNEDRRSAGIYAQRSRVAVFAHAWIKERCGLRQFRCRGRLKATMEATWACLSYNLMR